jgi:hypothetical protein
VSYVIRGVLDEGSDFGLLGGGLVIPNAHLTQDFDARADAFVFLRYAPGADPSQTRAAIDRALATGFPDTRTATASRSRSSRQARSTSCCTSSTRCWPCR